MTDLEQAAIAYVTAKQAFNRARRAFAAKRNSKPHGLSGHVYDPGNGECWENSDIDPEDWCPYCNAMNPFAVAYRTTRAKKQATYRALTLAIKGVK